VNIVDSLRVCYFGVVSPAKTPKLMALK